MSCAQELPRWSRWLLLFSRRSVHKEGFCGERETVIRTDFSKEQLPLLGVLPPPEMTASDVVLTSGWGGRSPPFSPETGRQALWRSRPPTSRCLSLCPRLSPLYAGAGDPVAPVRTAKAERRHQERLRMQSPELLSSQEKELSPAERRALEAEKRAMWRAAR